MPDTTYAGLTIVGKNTEPHLGGNAREGDPYTFCPHVWSYVIERFAIASVLDLGSGIGNAADWFFRKGLRTVAVDGMIDNVQPIIYPAVCHDLTKGPVVATWTLCTAKKWSNTSKNPILGNILASLACGRVILMTHALPGQTGYHHVNLQPMEYWVRHLTALGYNLMVEDTNRIRVLGKQEHAVYIENTGLLFHRK